MQDKLLIITRIKKTIEYIEKMVKNYPHSEVILKNKIIDNCYQLLEISYRANIYKNVDFMKDIIVRIRMLEFYIKKSLDKKVISYKKYEIIGNHLLEINKMVNVWILNEAKK